MLKYAALYFLRDLAIGAAEAFEALAMSLDMAAATYITPPPNPTRKDVN